MGEFWKLTDLSLSYILVYNSYINKPVPKGIHTKSELGPTQLYTPNSSSMLTPNFSKLMNTMLIMILIK